VDPEEVKSMFYQLYGDRNRYMQIVLNFLSNAIHYNKKGGSISINLVLLEEQLIRPKKPMHS
jgi:signal transduction histidine kinase